MLVKRYRKTEGVALVIVLCFVVLLTIVVLALLNRSLSNGLISGASANGTRTELYAHGSIDQILGDLRQEIADGSLGAATDASGATISIYRPSTTWNEVPYNSGPASYGKNGDPNALWNNPTSGFPNLVKQSANGVPFYTTANSASPVSFNQIPVARACNVSTVKDAAYIGASSVAGTSLNGRYLSPAEWNQAFLLPKNALTGTDSTPITGFVAPDWILSAVDGSNPTTWNKAAMTDPQAAQYVVGRYAYTIYNEGGLLDANVAGSPGPGIPLGNLGSSANSNGGPPQQTTWSRKGSQAFADLTQLSTTAVALGVTFPQSVVDQLVGWRNYATAGSNASGFPTLAALTSTQTDSYFAYILGSTTQFLTASSNTANTISDRRFTSRQAMLSFFNDAVAAADQPAMQNAMMYFTHFSRSLNQPSYWPDPNTSRPRVQTGAGTSTNPGDDVYNPPFRKITVSTSFTRKDGTTAIVGEPLIKKRFALNRLIWLTYEGPSSTVSHGDSLYLQYQKLLPPAPLSQLWDEGTPQNIADYFGLKWNAGPGTGGAGGYWTYNVHTTGSHANSIATLQEIESEQREPDFFELLQAAICRGSLGATQPTISTASYGVTGSQQILDAQVDYQVFQIGADIIDQVSPDDFPTNIVFSDNIAIDIHTFWGKKDLPYFWGVGNVGLVNVPSQPPPPDDITPKVTPITKPGQNTVLAVPLVWNPCAPPATSSTMAPTKLRLVAYDFSSYYPSLAGASGIAADFNYQETNPPTFWGRSPASWPSGQMVPSNGWVVGLGQAIPEGNPSTALLFNNATNLYREPTPLFRSPTATINPRFSNITSNAARVSGLPDVGDTTNLYVGFLMGQGAVLFSQSDTESPPVTKTYTVDEMDISTSAPFGVTYALQYQIGNSWIPYQQYTMGVDFAGFKTQYNASNNSMYPIYTQTVLQSWPLGYANGSNAFPPDPGWRMAMVYDPRSLRWGTSKDQYFTPFLTGTGQSVVGTVRPDGKPSSAPFDNFGLATQNLASVGTTGALSGYKFTDPDGVVRRAMGAYVPTGGDGTATTSAGLPMATVLGSTTNTSNRPVILHRPFQSVSELGYVFRDTPWKNIDFFTPESGDTALLDVFCINEDSRPDALSEGKVDLNTKQIPVIQALLAGAYRDEVDPSTNPALTSSEATAIATALVSRTESSLVNKGPLLNIAELVGHYVKSPYVNSYGQPYDGFSNDLGIYTAGLSPANNYVQRFRESTMRALGDTGQAGTWNLMIDLVAQSGRFPSSASGLTDFIVEGERHFWVHVAIDRSTDQVIDESIEPVTQ